MGFQSSQSVTYHSGDFTAPDEEIIGFHRNLLPFKAKSIYWWEQEVIKSRHNLPPPMLSLLASVFETPIKTSALLEEDPDLDELLN